MFSFGRTTITTSAAHTITPTARVASDTNTMTASYLRPRRPFSAPASPSRLSKALSRASLSHLRRRSCPEVPTKQTTETTETTHTPLPQYPHHIISAAMSIHSVLRILGCAPQTHDSHHYTYPVLLDFIMHVLHTSEVPYAIVEHITSLLSRYDAYALAHEERVLSGHELFLGLLILLTPYYFPPKLEKKEEEDEEDEEEEKFTNEFWCEISGVTSFHSMHMLHAYMRLDGALGPLYPSVDVESLPTMQEAQFELPKIVL
ncbi:hypothetical protein NLJ89_g6592 [Agrocybe chaxingu]|uniref:Uncharacterized protein n=1 Tax=Agrocybe chaxingu TaxID=84603 RepID=A0A9W8MSJ5_9AGAR|nr:hypothetical protein NLJ89_g6592 [Agrocybe chaxingu]